MFLWYLFYNSPKLRINARACLKLYSVYKCIIKRRQISKKIHVNAHVCTGVGLRGRGPLKGPAVNQFYDCQWCKGKAIMDLLVKYVCCKH